MLTVHPLASSSEGNCILLRDGEHALMIEAGLAWRQIQRGLGYATSRVSGVLISHEHADHARSVRHALRRGLHCYMTAGTARALGLADGAAGLHLVKAGRLEKIGPWTVAATPLPHEGAQEPSGFLISAPSGDRAAYVCDAAYSPVRFAGVTHWLVEANYDQLPDGLDEAQYAHIVHGHMSLRRCIELLLANDRSQSREVWLLHLSGRHSDEAAFCRAVREATALATYAAPGRFLGERV